MLLSARMLNHVVDVNTFEAVPTIECTQGDSLYVYFQLIDSSLDRSTANFSPPGRRYVPASGATLSVVIQSNDTAKVLTKTATQPYSQDASIWRIQLAASDNIVGSKDFNFTLTEGSTVTRGVVYDAITCTPQDGRF